MKHDLLEELQKYYTSTPRPKIDSDWDKYAKFDAIGPKVNDLLQYFDTHFPYEEDPSLEKQMKNKIDQIESPVMPGFFMYIRRMTNAAFSLDTIEFNKIKIDSGNYFSETPFQIDFEASGTYIKSKNAYELNLIFRALHDIAKKDEAFVMVNCKADFIFNEETRIDGIPDYFYRNSIAIVYPFIRAFISSVTLQANVKLILLPTRNLTSLEAPLKANTIFEE